MRQLPRAAQLCAVAAGAFLTPALALAGVADFRASLVPRVSFTQVDSLAMVTFTVDSTAMCFNAYEVTIQFDPSVVSFVSVQEGALMTGACSNRFKFTSTTDSTVTYSHSLLCAGVALDGPGELSTFTFRGVADGTSFLAIISPSDVTFFDAGIFVSPSHPSFPRQVVLQGGFIAVGPDPTPAEVLPPGDARLRLEFRPNPTRDFGAFQMWLDSPGPVRLDVVDVAGRRVLAREWTATSATLEHRWSLVGPGGRPLPAGSYFARLQSAGSTATIRLVLVR